MNSGSSASKRMEGTDAGTAPVPLDHRGLARAVQVLGSRDRDLARLAELHGVPPLWRRPRGFATLVLIILEQQVSLASARAVFERLQAATGEVTYDRLLALDTSELRSIGFSRQKAGYVCELARNIEAGRFDPDALERLPDPAAHRLLLGQRGIGAWTAEIYLLMALLRPDAWPAGDLALQVAAQEVKGLGERPSAERMSNLAEIWRPWRAVAARLLWQHYLAR